MSSRKVTSVYRGEVDHDRADEHGACRWPHGRVAPRRTSEDMEMSVLSTGTRPPVRDSDDAATPAVQKAPRIRLRDLLSLIKGERGLVAVVAALSAVAAGVSLAQPVVVADVIAVVEAVNAVAAEVAQ